MNSDSVFLGMFSGVLLSNFLANLALAKFHGSRRYLMADGALACFAIFFLLDKQAIARGMEMSSTSVWLAFGACPLLIGMIMMAMILRNITSMKEAKPGANKLLLATVAIMVAAVVLFVLPVGLAAYGPPGMGALLESKLLPLGFAVVTGFTAFGWLLSILMTPPQLGEWRIYTLFSVLLFTVFLVLYNLSLYGILPFDNALSDQMRIALAGSGICLTLTLFRQAGAAQTQRDRADGSKKRVVVDWEEKQNARQAMNNAHLMRVLRREKELEAELRKREAEQMDALRIAKQAADETAQNKAQFLAFMSHEIRTPLNGIMGMVRLLMNTDITDQQKDYIQTLNYSGDALLALVNDTLDISKIEAGQLVLEQIDFDLQRLISSIIMLMSARASEKNLLIRSDIASAVPRFIKGDPTRLRQILLNLINNAIKFTEEGGITVAVRVLSGAVEEKMRLRFEVQDTGPGIPESARDRLFKEYQQVDASTTRLYGGTGLGLSICKQLVQAMEGEIGVDSRVSQGSVFWFVVDFTETRGDALGEMPGPVSGNPVLSAMVIEDNEIHQKVIGGYLRLDGHDVTLVNNAEEALENLDRKNYDVLMMDVNLPGMNGNEATRRIRGMDDPVKRSVPIIAITGNTAPADIDECRSSGMDDFVGKPVDPDVLRATVFATHKAWMARRSEGGHDIAPALRDSARHLKILVIDDNAINQKVIAGFLQIEGHAIDYASTGERGVSMATNTIYDVILMDVTLPGIDGLEASRLIRELPDPRYANVPIVAITGNTAREDIEACRAAGMNDFLGKPVDPDSLDAVLARVQVHRQDSLDDYLPHSESSIQLLDEPVLKRLAKAFDSKTLGGLFDDMIAESGPMIAGMEQSTRDEDLGTLRVQAHTLKGMAMTLGIVGVGELAADIESSIQRGEAPGSLIEMVRQLGETFEQSVAAIDRWRQVNAG